MKHQPYEDWILDEIHLSEEQKAELETHLLTCNSCANLRTSWETASGQLRAVPFKKPSAGFAVRWQASLNDRKLAEEHKHRRTVWIWVACIAAAILVSMAVVFLPRISFIQVLIDLVESIVGVSTGVAALIQLLKSIARSVPPFALIIASLSLSTLLSITIFLWGVSIWRMSRKGVVHHEEN